MKIGFLYDAVYPWIKGGGEKTLYELACALRDRGHECHLFGMHLWDGPRDVVRDGLHYHAVAPRMTLYKPGGGRRAAEVFGFAWGVLRNLPRYDLQSFDLFDVHALPYFSVPGFWLARKLRGPRLPWLLTWLEVWGPDYWRGYVGRKGAIGAAVERWCARVGPHHLCISPTTGRRLHELLRADRSRTTVIPRGFAPSASASMPREPGRVVVAGRLVSYKRVDVAIRAWPLVLRSVPDAVLEVVGDGPERSTLEQLAIDVGAERAVRFAGQLPEHKQVLEKIAAASLLLQPSQREGQSTVVLEALAAGTPVLAAVGDLTAVGDFLGRESATAAARLPLDANPEAWAERIGQLLADAPLRAALVEEGRRAVAALDWRDSIAPQVEALYFRLAGTVR